MNKAELVERVSEATGQAKSEVDNSLRAILGVITEELSKGNKITLVGFGTFERRNRKARTGVNPQNPTQKIKIPAKKAPAFTAGSELKSAVQTGKAPSLAGIKKIAATKSAAKAKVKAVKTTKKKAAGGAKKKAKR